MGKRKNCTKCCHAINCAQHQLDDYEPSMPCSAYLEGESDKLSDLIDYPLSKLNKEV